MYGEFIAFSSAFVFALSNSMFRNIDRDVPPSQINAIRTSVAFVSFLITTTLFGWLPTLFRFSARTWLFLFLSIVTGQVIGDTAYFYSQRVLGTANALTISLTSPFFAMIFSVTILHEEPGENLLISALVITLGVGMIIYSKEETVGREVQERTKVVLAFSLALLAASMWALGLVLIEQVTTELDQTIPKGQNSTLIANTARFPFAVISMLFIVRRTERRPLRSLSRRTKLWLLTASLIGSSLGAWLWAESARVAGASFASIVIVTSPLMAIPISYMMNRETINWRGFLGVIITISGIIMLIVS